MEHIILQFNQELYPKEAVMKAAYHFIDRCYVHVDLCDADYVVTLTAKKGIELGEAANELKNELLAQAVRYQVYLQTHTLREILMARAMSSTITGIDYGSDTVQLPEQVDHLESILMDWFEKNET